MSQLPNIRRTIVPDPGMILIEVDLKQADAQIVAWEANDEPLKSLFRQGIDIYTERQTGIWSNPGLPSSRQIRKNCIHSVNYGAAYRTLAERYVGTEAAARHFIESWFDYHPAIHEWQRRIEWEMTQSRTPSIRNIYGYRRLYACPTPLTQPLAWLGQSTVARVNKEMLLALATLEPTVQILMPHHDSVLLQVPVGLTPDIFPKLLELCAITVPYKDDPLVIPCDLKYSDQSWGDMLSWSPEATNAD
jgi:hypothetical protein